MAVHRQGPAARQAGGLIYLPPSHPLALPGMAQASGALVALALCAGAAQVSANGLAAPPPAPAMQWTPTSVGAAARQVVQAASLRDQKLAEGLALYRDGRLGEATEFFRALVRDHPDWAEAQNNVAVLLAARGDYEGARHWLESAVRTEPAYAGAYRNLGDTYAKLAAIAYDRAQQLDRSDASLQAKLAAVQRAHAADSTVARREERTPAPALAASPLPSFAQVAVQTPVQAPVQAQVQQPVPHPVQKPSQASLQDDPAPLRATVADDAELRTIGNDRQAVNEAVQAWATAWTRRDVAAYLQAYEPDYAPRGRSRDEWEQERHARIGQRQRIALDLERLRMSVDGDEALVRFRQRYRSEIHASTDEKVLMLRRNSAGQWLIAQEVARPSATPVASAAPRNMTSTPLSTAQRPSARPAAPQAAGTEPGATVGDAPQRVMHAVQQWARAWSRRDNAAYLAAYAADYAPQGMSRLQWVSQSRSRTAAHDRVSIDVADLRVQVDGDKAVAAFRHHYRSGSLLAVEEKALWFQRVASGRWLIVREASGELGIDQDPAMH